MNADDAPPSSTPRATESSSLLPPSESPTRSSCGECVDALLPEPEAAAPTSASVIPAVEGLRTFATLGVFLTHLKVVPSSAATLGVINAHFIQGDCDQMSTAACWFWGISAELGDWAVSTFFVVSGFLSEVMRAAAADAHA